MRLLAVDTALGACSCAIVDDARVLAHRFEIMERGHAERLAPMVDEAMRETGLSFADLERLAVTTGPGTFTGQRVGLAFARGLRVALKIPLTGITTLEAMATAAIAETGAEFGVAIHDAKRNEVYFQLLREEETLIPSTIAVFEDAVAAISGVTCFSRINLSLLWVALVLTLACVALVFTLRRRLDVLNLGRDVAINLGVPYRRTVTLLLVVASVLISINTTLIGPMLFFGLLATNLAYWVSGTHQHRWTLLTTVLVAVVCLVGGQLLVEQILQSRLPFVMLLELCGGLLFILLLLRGVRE